MALETRDVGAKTLENLDSQGGVLACLPPATLSVESTRQRARLCNICATSSWSGIERSMCSMHLPTCLAAHSLRAITFGIVLYRTAASDRAAHGWHQFGCESIGKVYSQNGDVLRVRACVAVRWCCHRLIATTSLRMLPAPRAPPLSLSLSLSLSLPVARQRRATAPLSSHFPQSPQFSSSRQVLRRPSLPPPHPPPPA